MLPNYVRQRENNLSSAYLGLKLVLEVIPQAIGVVIDSFLKSSTYCVMATETASKILGILRKKEKKEKKMSIILPLFCH